MCQEEARLTGMNDEVSMGSRYSGPVIVRQGRWHLEEASSNAERHRLRPS